MALGPQTTTYLRGIICTLAGALLLVALVFHWYAVAVVMGGYWVARGGLAIYRAHLRPRRAGSIGLVAVLSLVTGVLVLLASPWGAGAGIGLSLVMFIGLQALVTGAVDISQGLYDGRACDCGFGLVAFSMGTGLWFVPFFGFEFSIAMMGLVACAVGMGAMVLSGRRPRRRLYAVVAR